jgi:hypothetical protein
MKINRIQPTTTTDELETLSMWLDFHRATLELKCLDLDGDALRKRSVAPSDLSLLGLVRHMARVERYYFRITFAGEDLRALFEEEDSPDASIIGVDRADVDESFRIWRQECDEARRIVNEAQSLDQISINEHRSRGHFSLRFLLVFMIQEYARHNGHADLLRERIDGTTGT